MISTTVEAGPQACGGQARLWTAPDRNAQRSQPVPVNETLAALAVAQGGAWTRAQAVAAGCTPGEIRGLLGRTWTDPYRGVYVDRAALASATRDQRHVLLAAARVLTTSLDAVVSHRTAALVHGLPLLGRPPTAPQLSRAPRRPRDRSETSWQRVAPLPPTDRAAVRGVPVTSLARTASDVARTSSFREAVVVADAVLRRGAELASAVAQASSWPGGRQALRVAAFADGRADGPLESLTRVAYAGGGLPPPETQVEVRGPDGTFLGLVDFLWREERVVGEADGLEKYDAPLALRKEKLREEGLRACGLEVVRSGWDDVWTAPARARTIARVRQAFALAADRPLAPGVSFRSPPLAELLSPPWLRPY